jgi:hypothetical protein
MDVGSEFDSDDDDDVDSNFAHHDADPVEVCKIACILPQIIAKNLTTNGTFQAHRSKIERKLLRLIQESIMNFDMIREGDRVMVAVSGSTDSLCVLDLLHRLCKNSSVKFEVSL